MKQLSGSLTMLCVAFWLGLSQTHCASAQEPTAGLEVEPKQVSWADALVRVRAGSTRSGMTGVVVKAASDTALVLTTFEQLSNAQPYFSPNGEEMMVSIKAKDGKLHELKGKVSGVFATLQSSTGAFWHTTFVEVKHKGLKFAAVPIAESVPVKDTSLTVVGRHWPDSTPAATLQPAKLVSEIDPAVSPNLEGQLSGTSLLPESLLTVHDENGILIGIGSPPNPGGMGGGGFGGGGGFFSVPDPLNNGFGETENQPISFISVVDRAEQLRQMGVPVSDAAIKLQKQRRRINTDVFGRPIQGVNLQITWSDDHTELHGFSNTLGEWAKLAIKEQNDIIPIVGENVGAVSLLDGKVAGYSPATGQWDVLTLPAGSTGYFPVINKDVASVRTGKDYYTFAASSGIWTSPTSADYQKHEITRQTGTAAGFQKLQESMRTTNNRAIVQVQGRGMMTITGPRHHVVAAELLAKEAFKGPRGFGAGELTPLPGLRNTTVQDAGPGVLSPATSNAESESLNIAKRLRDAGQTAEPNKATLQKLKDLVTESFDQRLQKQKAAAAELKKKLQAIEKSVQSRETNRERIIERRVEELVDPNIDWSSLQPSKPVSHKTGMPVTGRPIGLPGPSHIASGTTAENRVGPNSEVPKLLESLKKAKAIAVEVHAPGISQMRLKLTEFQQPLQTLQKIRGKSFTATKQQEAIQTTRDYLKSFTEKFRNAFATWELTWSQYEAQLESKRLDAEDARAQLELAQDKFDHAQQCMQAGDATLIEVKELETQLKLQGSRLKRAQSAFEAIEKLGNDFPELDPTSFNTTKLLDGE